MMLPAAKMPPAAHWGCTPPYYTITGGEVAYVSDSLEEAIHMFVRYCLPPNDSRPTAGVMDVDGVICVSYHYLHPQTNESPAFEWHGTSDGINMLIGHPLVPPLLRLDIEKVLA